jgi:hypothetical protein
MQANHQKMCPDDQRQMMLPVRPTAHCILAHPQPWLAVFEARFNRPPPPTQPHLGGPWGVGWGLTPVSLQRPRVERPPQHQPDVRTGQGVSSGDHPTRSKRRDQGALAAFFDRRTRPRRGGPGARPRPVWCAALRPNTTGPTVPPHPERLGHTRTPRPPPPSDTAGSGTSPPQRAAPRPTLAWF